MATTLPGSPYVESSDLVANYPAVSEALAERVDLVGVLPFADSAARTTALPTPTDGQYSYLQDTNSTEYYDGAAWVAAGGAGALVHLTTNAFSAVASVSLNDIFTGDYDNYLVLISNLTNSITTDINIRLRASGVDNTASNYEFGRFFIGSQASIAFGSTNNITDNKFLLCDMLPDSNVNLNLTIYSPKLSTKTAVNTQSTGANLMVVGGAMTVTTSYDGATFYVGGGVMTGTIRVYGIQNS